MEAYKRKARKSFSIGENLIMKGDIIYTSLPYRDSRTYRIFSSDRKHLGDLDINGSTQYLEYEHED